MLHLPKAVELNAGIFQPSAPLKPVRSMSIAFKNSLTSELVFR